MQPDYHHGLLGLSKRRRVGRGDTRHTAVGSNRLVIVFDNTGVGHSNGRTPDNVAQMAKDAGQFLSALGFSRVDLLGFR